MINVQHNITLIIYLLLSVVSATVRYINLSFTLTLAPQNTAKTDVSVYCSTDTNEPTNNINNMHSVRFVGPCLTALSAQKDYIVPWTRGQSNLTKSASRGAHSLVRGHPRGSKVVPLNGPPVRRILATVHARDNQPTTNNTAYLNKRLF